ncbi:MAG: DUF2993 domain-containing protein [Thermostichales cyanobacterium SZTDM-1c_bins_54]
MEWIAGLVALVASLGGGVSYLVDQAAQNFLRSQLDQVEVLEVRVESQPNYRLLEGNIDRILVAGRGLERDPFPRIALLEVETDPIRFDPGSLNGGRVALSQPLQAALRIQVTKEDLNAALQAPQLLKQFQNIEADIPLLGSPDGQPQRINLRDPQIQFLPEQRIQLSAQLEQILPGGVAPSVEVVFTAGVAIDQGKTVRLVQPQFTIGSVPVPSEITNAFLGGLNEVFDLETLEEDGIVVRILRFSLTPETVDLVGFVRVESL